MNLISIIIPVYNRPEAFQKTLASVLRQTYTNIEVIVVDDGSDIDLTTLPPNHLTTDKRVKMFRQENQGAPVARNRGFDESKGEFVIFIDADVVLESDMIEKMYNILIEQQDIDFVYCNFKLDAKLMRAKPFSLEELQKINFISPMSLMRRTIFPRFDEYLKKFQDWDLFLMIAKCGGGGYWIDETLFSTFSGGTMSSWLPRFAYKKPWKYLPWFRKNVKKYEEAKQIIVEKHQLI
ncbi:MAG: glycosyltransferase [Candidatus Magasanikbacteria bacterium]|nr:glycosyltransferase [Candidatus Magasanikbacteria bacterium]